MVEIWDIRCSNIRLCLRYYEVLRCLPSLVYQLYQHEWLYHYLGTKHIHSIQSSCSFGLVRHNLHTRLASIRKNIKWCIYHLLPSKVQYTLDMFRIFLRIHLPGSDVPKHRPLLH